MPAHLDGVDEGTEGLLEGLGVSSRREGSGVMSSPGSQVVARSIHSTAGSGSHWVRLWSRTSQELAERLTAGFKS